MAAPANSRPTALERALSGDGAERPTPLDALRLGRRRWLAGERLDMGALARELGISRATLYSWVGGKERLLGEVIWSFADSAIGDARAAARGSGAEYVTDAIERYMVGAIGFPPLRRFIQEDPEYALKVLASKHSPMQRRSIAAMRTLLDEQVRAGALEPPLDLDSLAYLIVRIAESFLYSDVITGSEPDVEKAVEAVRVLLHAPPLPPRRKSRRRRNRS